MLEQLLKLRYVMTFEYSRASDVGLGKANRREALIGHGESTQRRGS